MPQQPDPAVPTRLACIHYEPDKLRGSKVRIAGRMLSYDAHTGLALLQDGSGARAAVLADVSGCVDPGATGEAQWARERKGIVMLVGYVEQVPDPLPIPLLPAYASAPAVDPSTIVRALLVMPAGDLDLRLWDSAIAAREQHGTACTERTRSL